MPPLRAIHRDRVQMGSLCPSRFSARLQESSVCRHEPRQHRRDQLYHLHGLARLLAECLAICDEVAMDAGRELNRELYRLVVWNC